MDTLEHPALTLKVIGRQWYWSYETSNSFYGDSQVDDSLLDHYMDLDLTNFNSFHLLKDSGLLTIPTQMACRILITSTDVIHSWALPALGIKVDACPGRLNDTALNIPRVGVFFGQCSELCGANHSFMPITITGVVGANVLKAA